MFTPARRRLQRLLVAVQVVLLVATLVGPSVALGADPPADPGGSPPPAAEPSPTPTPEATPDPTPDATPEATPEANPTPEATPEATPEPTPEATPTPDATPEPTPEATPTPDATPTPEATPDPSPSPSPDPSPSPTPTPTPAPTDPYIVTFVFGTSAEDQSAAIAAAEATDESAIAPLRMHVVSATADAAAALALDPSVLRLELDASRTAEADPSDTEYANQWSLPRIGWDTVYGSVTPAGSAVVALLDTGVDAAHPDLAGSLVAGTSILDGSDGATDPNGHGTALAGIIAATTDNATGIAGVGYAGVSVMPVTVLGADGTGQDSDIIAGIVYAVDHGADVIVMAFSSTSYSAALQAAIDYAWWSDVVLVASVGNDASADPAYPAGDRGVIGVSNTDQSDALNPTSNIGEAVFLAAPGTDIVTLGAGGGTTTISGTSASAAEVAGAAALLRAIDPAAWNGVIVSRLARSADGAGTFEETGNGRLNIARAVGDTSTDAVVPAGAPGGGPFVGPYVIDAVNAGLEGAGDWSATGSTCATPNNAISDAGASSNVRALCAFGQTVVARDFGLAALVPSTATDISFVVTTRGEVSNVDDNDIFDVSLSYDGGTNYTTAVASEIVNQVTGNATDENADAPPVASNCAAGSNFGRTWTYAEISDANFRARVAAHPKTTGGADATLQTMSIDDIDLTVCWAARVITAASVTGSEENNPGTRNLSVTVNHSLATGFSAATADDWGSTSYLVEGGSTVCVDVPTPDITAAGTDTRDLPPIEPPLSGGPYDVTFIAYRDSACSVDPSPPFVITDAITVDPSFPTLHRSSESQTSATFAHTVPAGSDRLLLVAVMIDGGGGGSFNVASATYAGTPLTLAIDSGNVGGCSDCQRVLIYRLTAPPVGTANVVVTFSGSVAYEGVAASNYTGVDQVSPIGATAAHNGGVVSGNTTISQAITTTTAGSTIFGAVSSGGDASAPFTTSSPVAELWDGFTGGGGGESADAGLWGGQLAAPTIGAYNIGTNNTAANGTDWVIAAVEIKSTANTAPVATTPSFNPASPHTNDLLDGSTLVTDADGDSSTVTFLWKVTRSGNTCDVRSFTESTGTASGSTHTDTLDLGISHTATNCTGAPLVTINPSNGDVVTLTVTPNDGTVDGAPKTNTVTIVNDAPVCQDVTLTTDENTVGSTAPDCTDADGDTLTYTVSAAATGISGTSLGSLTYDPNGQFEYLDDTESASDAFTYTANDGDEDSAAAAVDVTITGVNDAPVCQDVTLTTDENTVGSTAPDCTDADGDTLTYTVSAAATGISGTSLGSLTYDPNGQFEYLDDTESASDAFTYTANDGDEDSAAAAVDVTITGVNDAPVCQDVTLTTDENTVGSTAPDCTDADGDTLTYTVSAAATGISGTSLGSLTYDPNGQFEYLDDTESASDAFTYTANDGDEDSAAAAVDVTITGVNDAPVCQDVTLTTDENTVGSTAPDCTDADGDTLTYTVSAAATGISGTSLGSLTYDPNGQFEYLDDTESASDAFTYTANDGDEDSAAAAVDVTITGVNDAPVCQDVTLTTDENTVGSTAPDCTDADGDTLTYTVSAAATGISGTSLGSLTYDPNGQFEYLDDTESASDAFTYTANDGDEDSAAAAVDVTITGVNDAPVCQDVTLTTDENTVGSTAPDCTDADGDTLTYTVSAAATGISGTSLGSLTYDPNGQFEYLDDTESASDAFTYTANDGDEDSAAAAVDVTITGVNDAPVCQDVTLTTDENTVGSTAPDCTDADGDTLTYTVSAAATGISGTSLGSLTYDPNGQFEYLDDTESASDAFTYTANDGDEDSAAAAVDVTITGVNDAPVVTLDPGNDLIVDEGTNHTYAFSIFDVEADSIDNVTVSCGLNGSQVGLATFTDTSGSFVCSFPDGDASSTVSASATDSDGDPGAADTQDVTINNVAPTVTLDPGNDLIVDEGTNHTYAFSISDPGDDTVTAVTVSCGLNGSQVGLATFTDTSGSFVCSFPDGDASSTVSASATDSDGDPGAADTQDVTINNVAPTVTLDPGNDLIVDEGTNHTYAFSISDPGDDTVTAVTVSCGLNGSQVGLATFTDTSGSFVCSFPDGDASSTVSASATDSDGDPGAADTQDVTIINVAPTVPILSTPLNNAHTNDATPNFEWSDSTDPAGTNDTITYRIQADDSGCTFASPEIDQSGLSTSDFTPVTNLADGTYCWRVSASDEDGGTSAYSATRNLLIDTYAPPTPVLVAPPNNSVLVFSPTLDWTDVTDSIGPVSSPPVTYTVQIQATSGICDFASSVTTVSGLSTSSYSPGFANGTYCWRVSASDAVGNSSAYTSPWKFTLDTNDPDGDGIPSSADCTTLKDTVLVDPSGTLVLPDFISGGGQIKLTLQAAVIAALDNGVISMYGNTTENVIIGTSPTSNNKDLHIIGCGHKVTAASAASPVITVLSTAGKVDGAGGNGTGEKDIHIDDVNVIGGTYGYLVQTGPTTTTLLKSLRAMSNSLAGVRIVGSKNEVRGADGIESTTAGIQVVGDSNLLLSNRVHDNTGIGIETTGNSNTVKANNVERNTLGGIRVGLTTNTSNMVLENNVFSNGVFGMQVNGNTSQIFKNDVGEAGQGNTGIGIAITGNTNQVGKAASENDVFANTGDGMVVTGNNNTINKNDLGDRDKGNGGDGLRVVGTGNTISENRAFANGGDGIEASSPGGVVATTSSNKLLKNDSGDSGKGNGGDGYHVVGSGNTLTENDAFANGGDGLDLAGNSNTVSLMNLGDNGAGNGQDGLHLAGNSNTVQTTNAYANGGDGFDVAGNTNTIKSNNLGDSGKGNGQDTVVPVFGNDGLHLSGIGNTVQGNAAYANPGDGFDVSGGMAASPNRLYQNLAGSSGKGNGGDGVRISSDIGNTAGVIELESNTTKGNTLAGIKVLGSAHQLKNNLSGGSGGDDNGGLEFQVVAGNIDSGGNKANGVAVSGAFPWAKGTGVATP